MPRNLTVIDLRNAIENVYRDVLETRGGEASNKEILGEVRARLAEEIRRLSTNLIDSTLTKLINDVSGRRRAKASNADGPDLFGEYPGIRRTIVPVRGKKKDVAKTTFFELDQYVKAHDKKSQDRNKELKNLLEDCREHVRSPEDTMEILIRRRNEAAASARRRRSAG